MTNEQQKANRAYCVSRGLCIDCYGKRYAIPGKRLCAACAQKRRDNANARLARFKALGVCPYCREHRPVIAGTGYCAECKARMHERQRQRRAKVI